jgi:adenylate kinase
MSVPTPATWSDVLFFPFIAPPNGGKGTQTSVLAKLYGMPRIDMGSILRVIAKDDTPLGRKVQERLAGGLLVDIDTVIDALKAGIEKQLPNVHQAGTPISFILDGFPRNAEQTDALLVMCQNTGAQIGAAIYLDVPYAEIEARAVNRRICADCGAIYNLISHAPKQAGVCDACGGTHLEHRVDDQPEKVKIRLAGFDAETLPILHAFESKGLLKRLNGNQSVEAVTEELKALMQTLLPNTALKV